MVHQIRPAQPAVLAQRLPGLVQNQVRELVVPDGRVGHVPAVRIHIGSFLHEAKADAYVYGYELLISSVVSVLLVILVSAVCGDVRYSLSFLIGFIPQRIYIGGYHATSHTRCYLAFTGLALICILLSKVIAANHLFRILTTAALMGIAIFFSPIEATNKPLGKKKRLSYKMVASVLSSIDFLFAIFNVLPDTRSITVYYISKWVLVIFAIIPFFQKQAKIS